MRSASTDARGSLVKLFPSISVETVNELEERGLLQIAEGQWRLGDKNNGSTRRLDNRKWRRADNSGDAWHKLIGLDDVVQNDRRRVIFVIEGSKDALTAAELARRFGVLAQVGIICALGSGYRPIAAELEQLRGRSVLLIGDNDAAGMHTTQIVSGALETAAIDHEIWDWSDWPHKDLHDFVAAIDAGKQQFGPRNCTFFSSPLPSNHSTVQQFNRSTTQPVNGSTTQTFGLSEEEKLEIVHPFIVTNLGTGNFMSFQLARAIKHRKLSIPDIDEIVRVWFAKSRLFLPPDADETESLQTFYRQLKHV